MINRRQFLVGTGGVLLGLAGAGGLAATASGTGFSDDFEGYDLQSWAQGSVQGNWRVNWTGAQGKVAPVKHRKGQALQLEAHDNSFTSSSLITSVPQLTRDVRLKVRACTVRQLKRTPNPWETAWVGWHHHDLGGGARFYYVALKTNGLEVGKSDQSVAPDWQRFLHTDERGFRLNRWYDVEVHQNGAEICVWIDGELRAQVTDPNGPEGVYDHGSIVLYHEDARVLFDNVQAMS